MRTILISYDLVGTSESSSDYERLIAAIKAYPRWGRVNKSVWLIRTDDTCALVRDNLLAHMDSDDRLFVIRTYREAAWQKPMCDGDWLMDNLQD